MPNFSQIYLAVSESIKANQKKHNLHIYTYIYTSGGDPALLGLTHYMYILADIIYFMSESE